MTRMNTHRLPRLGLLAVAVLLLAPAASALPALPVGIGADSSLDTPAGGADARLDGTSAHACADAGIPALPVAAPVPVPALPTAGADTCIDADPLEGSASASACAEASGVSSTVQDASGLAGGASGLAAGASGTATGALGAAGSSLGGTASGALSGAIPALPGADLCAEVEEDRVSASGSAGPVRGAFDATVDAFQSAWGAIRGLF